MAIAFVNAARGGNTSSASSIASAATSATAGNLLVAMFYIDDSTKTPSGVPTDTAGNTYFQTGTTQQIGGGGGNMCIFYAYNCLGNASNIVTLSLSGSSSDRAYSVLQFSGVPTTDPKINTAFGTASSGTTVTTTTAVSHGSGSCVIIGWGVSFGSGAGPSSGGGGYTFTNFAITGNVNKEHADEYIVQSADDTPTMTLGATTIAAGLMGASFGTPNTVTTRRRFLLLGVGN